MILVLGATGTTGGLVAREVARRGLPLAIAGRDRGRLEDLAEELGRTGRMAEVRVASPADPKSLLAALEGAEAIVNTVGPFTELGEPVVRAAVERGVPYADTTGEQRYMRRILEGYDVAAREKGIPVICAHAFEYALGDCAAALATADGADRVDVYYVTSGASVTPGTAKSALRVACEPVLVWDGALKDEPVSSEDVEIPGVDKPRHVLSMPGGEALHLHRHRDVGAVRSWLGLPPSTARWVRWSTPLAPLLRLDTVKKIADKGIDRAVEAPTEAGRANTRFRVAARAKKGDQVRWVIVEGTDPYGLTGVIAAEGAERMRRGDVLATGVVSTSMAFEPRAFLDAVGVTVREVPSSSP